MNKKILILSIIFIYSITSVSAASDGFEDGDYTNDPTWDVLSENAQVNTENPKIGSYALEMPDGGGGNKIAHFRGDSTDDLADGDVYEAWVYTNSNIIHSVSANTQLGDSEARLQFQGTGDVNFQVYDSSGGQTGENVLYSGWSTNTWYKSRIVFYPSNSTVFGSVYDSSGNKLGSGELGYSGVSSYDYVYFRDYSSDAYTDEVTWTTTSLNDPPTINSFNVTPDPFSEGDSLTYDANVTDPENELQYSNLTVTRCGKTVVSDAKRTGNTPIWKDILNASEYECWYNATIESVDNDSAKSTDQINRYIGNDKPIIENTWFDPADPKYPEIVDSFEKVSDSNNATTELNATIDVLYENGTSNVTQHDDLQLNDLDNTTYYRNDSFEILKNNTKYWVNFNVSDTLDYDSKWVSFSTDPTTVDIRNVTIHENKTDLETGSPSPWDSKITADLKNFNGSEDEAWVEVYNNNESSLAWNHTLAKVNGLYENGFGFTEIQQREADYTYEIHVKDKSSTNTIIENYSEYHENDVVDSSSLPVGFNGSTLYLEDNLGTFKLKWDNWHEHTNAYNATIDIDYRVNSNESWNDAVSETISNKGWADASSNEYVTSGSANYSVNYTAGIKNIIEDNKDIQFRTTYKYFNESTGVVIHKEQDITYHNTSAVDFVLFNSFSQALTDTENYLSNIISTLYNIAVDIIYGIVDWIISAINLVLDVIIAFISVVVNIISYIVSMVIETVMYLYTIIFNYHTDINLINADTNNSIDIDNSSQNISQAINEGYYLESNKTILDNITTTNRTIVDAYGNLESNTIAEYEYLSSRLNTTGIATYTNANVTTKEYNTHEVNNFKWHKDCSDTAFYAYSDSCVNYKTSYGSTSTPDAWIKYKKSLKTDETNVGWYNTTISQQFKVNYDSGTDTYDYEPYALYLFNGSHKYDLTIAPHNNKGDRADEIYGKAFYRVERLNDSHINVTMILDGKTTAQEGYGKYVNTWHSVEWKVNDTFKLATGTEYDHDAWGDYPNHHAVYNITTDLNVVNVEQEDLSTIEFAWFSNPYDYPDGSPIGTIAVFSLLSGLVTFTLGLLPSSVSSSITGLLNYSSAVVKGTLSNIKFFMSMFTEVYVKGAKYIPKLVGLLGLWKLINWGQLIMDAMDENKSTTLSHASTTIIEDIKSSMIAIQEVTYRSIEIMARIAQVFMVALNTVKNMIKWW